MYRLLIADDEEIERKAIRYFIEHSKLDNVELYEAANGRQAIAKALAEKVDIIIMDVKMPGINGLEAIKQIKETLPDVQVIILTAFDEFEYAREGLRLNATDYLTKPANSKTIINAIVKACEVNKGYKDQKGYYIEIKEKYKQVLSYFERELLHLLIIGNLSDKEAREYFFDLGIKVEGYHCTMIKFYNDISAHKKKLLNKKLKRMFEMSAYPLIYWKNSVCFILVIYDEEFPIHNNYLKDVIDETYMGKYEIQISCNHKSFSNIKKYYNKLNISINHFDKKLSNVSNAIKYICEHINFNYKDDIRLEDFAGELGYSKFYLCKEFKNQKGITFVNFLGRKRIEVSCEYLSKTSKSIKEISELVGFRDPNYFTMYFKKSKGISPSIYREQNFIDNILID